MGRSVRPTRAQEAFAIILVAEGFGASWPRHGKSTGTVAAGQAGWEFRASEIFVQKPGVEAVAGADCIDCGDIQ